MSMLSEQLSAVFAAPIPFAIALLPLGAAMWGAFEWSYRLVLNKRKELYDLSRAEVDHWKNNAERTAKELAEKIGQLQDLTAEDKEQLGLGVSDLTEQLDRLGQANSSVISFENLRLLDIPMPSLTERSRRNPTDATGGSG
jgi:hypothetical protein